MEDKTTTETHCSGSGYLLFISGESNWLSVQSNPKLAKIEQSRQIFRAEEHNLSDLYSWTNIWVFISSKVLPTDNQSHISLINLTICTLRNTIIRVRHTKCKHRAYDNKTRMGKVGRTRTSKQNSWNRKIILWIKVARLLHYPSVSINLIVWPVKVS